MNTFSHHLMGNFLCDYVNEHYGIALDRADFLFGNILPDFRISFITRPHYLENNIEYLQSELNGLLNNEQNTAYSGKSFSKHLGVVCHYYADFFCYAHSDSFTGDLKEHIAYELDLHRFFEQHCAELNTISFLPLKDSADDALGLYRKFDTLHEQYLASRQSIGNDLVYTILACVDVIFTLVNAGAAKLPVCAESLPLYVPA